MKHCSYFKDKINCNNSDEAFSYLLKTLKNSITTWDYFVNWGKVFGNIKEFEIDLNTLNYLVGKDNIEKEFELLLLKHPSLARLIPVLIACRESKFEILDNNNKNQFVYENYDLGNLKSVNIPEVIKFAKSVGFLELLRDKKIKSLVDYVIGVEVGLDSNGRKNRSGKAMESIVEMYVKDICSRHKLEYMKEATSVKVKQKWGKTLKVDKSSRRIDFIVNSNKLFLIETNFYGGGGSKLKSTAGEYKSMYDFWKNDGHEFVWITDGRGWSKTHLPLRETFNHTDYTLNLEMVSKGLLEEIICDKKL